LDFAINVDDWPESTHNFLLLELSYKTHFLSVMNLRKFIKDKGTKLIYAPNNLLKLKYKR